MATKRTTEISFDFQVVIQEQSAVRTAEKNKIWTANAWSLDQYSAAKLRNFPWNDISFKNEEQFSLFASRNIAWALKETF